MAEGAGAPPAGKHGQTAVFPLYEVLFMLETSTRGDEDDSVVSAALELYFLNQTVS